MKRGVLKQCFPTTKLWSTVTDRFRRRTRFLRMIRTRRNLETENSRMSSKNGAPKAPRLIFHRIVRVRLVAVPAAEAVVPAMHVDLVPLIAPVARRRGIVAVAHHD